MNWGKKNTLVYLLTIKYRTAERSMAPTGIHYFVIQNVLSSVSGKKMSEIFQRIFLFLSKKSTLNRLLCKAGHIICSSSKGKYSYMHVWLLPPWHCGLELKQARLGFFWIRQTWLLLLSRHLFPWAKQNLGFPSTENWTLALSPPKLEKENSYFPEKIRSLKLNEMRKHV